VQCHWDIFELEEAWLPKSQAAVADQVNAQNMSMLIEIEADILWRPE
jgi:hypothetical protein